MRLAAVAAVLGLPSFAAAQAPGTYDPTPPLAPPGMTPPAGDTDEPPPAVPTPANVAEPALRAPSLTAVAPAPVPELTPLERAARRDAADDRAFGTSTALVVPDGQVDASLRFGPIGGIVGVAAGLGGGLEVSADVGGVVGEDGVGSYGVGAKLALARRGTWGLAIEGSYHKLGDSESDSIGLWSAGAVVSGCSDRDCTALVSIGGGVLGSDEGSGDTIPYAWASMLLGTGGFRPIVEGAVLQGGVLGFLGARMGGRHASLDLGLGILGSSDGGDGGALPVAALSVRP